MRPSVVTATYSENWGSTRRLGSRMSYSSASRARALVSLMSGPTFEPTSPTRWHLLQVFWKIWAPAAAFPLTSSAPEYCSATARLSAETVPPKSSSARLRRAGSGCLSRFRRWSMEAADAGMVPARIWLRSSSVDSRRERSRSSAAERPPGESPGQAEITSPGASGRPLLRRASTAAR